MSASKLSRLLWSDAAVCCYLLVVALLLPAQGLCTTGTGKACLIASTRKQTCMHVHYSMLCNSIGQLQLSAGCSEYSYARACTGFVQHGNTINTGCKACLTASTHANRHMHIYIRVFCSSRSCGCLQSILVTAYAGVCAACLETGTACKVHYTDATLSNRCSDVC
jgi:hypothetical protein